MKTKLEEKFKAQSDRMRTLARKNNISLDEGSLVKAWCLVSGSDKEYYQPLKLSLYRDGTVRPERHW